MCKKILPHSNQNAVKETKDVSFSGHYLVIVTKNHFTGAESINIYVVISGVTLLRLVKQKEWQRMSKALQYDTSGNIKKACQEK